VKPILCLPCDLTHWDSKGREVERGDPRATGVTLREPPKHRGGCGQTLGALLADVATGRDVDCAPQQNIAPKAPSSPVVETLPVRGTRTRAKRKTRQKRNGR
jgi:hypothetical protein